MQFCRNIIQVKVSKYHFNVLCTETGICIKIQRLVQNMKLFKEIFIKVRV